MIIPILICALLLFGGGVAAAFFKPERRARIFALISVPLCVAVMALCVIPSAGDFPVAEELDVLSRFFIFITGMGIAFGAIYNLSTAKLRIYRSSKAEIVAHQGVFTVLLGIFCAAMLIVPLIPMGGTVFNAGLFLTVWEIMSLASFLLIMQNKSDKYIVSKSVIYLIAMHLSAAGIMLGLIDGALNSGYTQLGLWALLLGFGIKIGMFPFHYWMPDSYDSAPGASAGLMSGVMVNMGIYGLIRTFAECETQAAEFGFVLLILGLFSALYGVIMALTKRDCKKILAASSMENMGLLTMGIGIWLLSAYVYDIHTAVVLAASGVLLHTLNHTIFKSMLFYSCDMLNNSCGTTDLEKLGGLGKRFKFLHKLILPGVLGIAAVPPFNGFVGKFLLYGAFFELLRNSNFHSLPIAVSAMVGIPLIGVVGALSLFVFVKFYTGIFSGAPRSEIKNFNSKVENRISLNLLRGMGLLCVLLGFAPFFGNWDFVAYGNVFKIFTVGGLLLYGIILIVGMLRCFLLRKRKNASGDTWGCGYERYSARTEYTPESLSMPFFRIMDRIFPREESKVKIMEIYPKNFDRGGFRYLDWSKDKIFFPLCRKLLLLLSRLRFLQSGLMQNYLWLSVLFLMGAIIYAILRR